MDQVDQENELQRAIDNITKNGGGQEQGGDVAAGLEEQIQNQMGTPPVPPMAEAGAGPAEAMPPVGEMPAAVGGDAGVAPVEGGEQVVESETTAVTPEGAEMTQEAVAVDAGGTPAMPMEGVAGDVAMEGGEGASGDTQAAETPVVEAAPVEPVMAEAATETVELSDMGGNDINSVKEAMLRDLFPIMDRVEMGAEEKFELYRTMLEGDNDKSLIAGAYEVVRGIADEGARAEALLFLIKKADA